MRQKDQTYVVRTKVGSEAPEVVDIKLDQTFESFNILSLTINQSNSYKMPLSGYGVVCGRVLANKGFGIPNAKVSVFIPYDGIEYSRDDRSLYSFTSVFDTSSENAYNDEKKAGIRYNLLPDSLDDACYQDVGTMFGKEFILDNNDVLKVFDKYYRYTTVTNNAGDYMIYGVPVGNQMLHVDIDLSDIGVLSQRPVDMMYKGYSENMFESPNKFKQDSNLAVLPQIKTQDRAVNVYPFWGDQGDNAENIRVTRCDFDIDYKFEPTCVFIGSIVTDSGSNAINHKCNPKPNMGRMSELSTGEGKIEMIRKTFDNKVEAFSVEGGRVIDGDGTWCYQIPMNLDYVRTDEFGNIVPTDNPDIGIPTRTKVRFRVSIDGSINDTAARKKAMLLIPNNPSIDSSRFPNFTKYKVPDYEFGTFTQEESFKDLFWNQVYTVKAYIPRLQKKAKANVKRFVGFKAVNHYGNSNPLPYNSLTIKFGMVYVFLCSLITAFTSVVYVLNKVITFISSLSDKISSDMVILLSGLCDDESTAKEYAPGATNKFVNKWEREHPGIELVSNRDELVACIRSSLAEDSESISFNFYNDWINGVLYAPLWYRKIRNRRWWFTNKIMYSKDVWCSTDAPVGEGVRRDLKLYQNGAMRRTLTSDKKGMAPLTNNIVVRDYFKKATSRFSVDYGLIKKVLTKRGRENNVNDYAYYYKPCEYDEGMTADGVAYGQVKRIFATDIVLLGSLNTRGTNGIPQFFKELESTTYQKPDDLLEVEYEVSSVVDSSYTDEDGKDHDHVIEIPVDGTIHTSATGCDWSVAGVDQSHKPLARNKSKIQRNGDDTYTNGGLFYSLTCFNSSTQPKSVINATRICEFGVSPDMSVDIPSYQSDGSVTYTTIPPDGYVSFDELNNIDGRSMFATMNINGLATTIDNRTGFPVYDLTYCYPENFDGSLSTIMGSVYKTSGYNNNEYPAYRYNNRLEKSSADYVAFRFGGSPKFYGDESSMYSFPIYENSFYFYFGLIPGKTAIDKFRSRYFAECENDEGESASVSSGYEPNSWCSEASSEPDGYILLDLYGVDTPYTMTINNRNGDLEYSEVLIGRTTYHYYTLHTSTSTGTLTDNGDLVVTGLTSESVKIGITTGDGYTSLADSDGYNVLLGNGQYVITITDSDGEEYKYNINFMPSRIGCQAVVTDFTLTNEELEEQYAVSGANLYAAIASNINGGSESRSIGGYLTVADITRDGSQVDYRLTLTPKSASDFVDPLHPEYAYNGCSFTYIGGVLTVDDSYTGTILNGRGVRPIIGLPKGDVQYLLTITELCDGADTNDTFSTYITAYQPVPEKMYVNGVDYSLISLFNTGWTRSSGSGDVNTSDMSSVIGWLDFDQVGGVSLIEFDSSKTYGDSGYIGDQVTLLNTVNNTPGTSNYTPYSFSDEYKYSFDAESYVTSYDSVPSGYSGNYIVVNGVYYQWSVSSYMVKSVQSVTMEEYYNGAETSEKQAMVNEVNGVIQSRYDLVESLKNAFWYTDYNKDYSVTIGYTGRNIPANYIMRYVPDSSNIYSTLDTTFSVDTLEAQTVPTVHTSNGSVVFGKKPYFTAVRNSLGKYIPNQSLSHTIGDREMDQAYMFGVHVVGKSLTIDHIAWSAMQGFPKWPSDLSYSGTIDGEYISLNGIVAGVVNDGRGRSYPLTNESVFDVQTYAGNTFSLGYYSGDTEMSFPCRRYIYTDPGSDVLPYHGYKVTNTSDECQYVLAGPAVSNIAIGDGTDEFTEVVNTSYYIQYVSADTVVDSSDSSTLTIRVAGTLTDGSSLYLFKHQDNPYPVTTINEAYESGVAPSGFGVMAYGYNFGTPVTPSDSTGGIYTIPVSGGFGQYYVVEVCADGKSRVMSQLYDLTAIDVSFDSGDLVVDLGPSSGVYHWYLLNYPFTAVVDGNDTYTSDPDTQVSVSGGNVYIRIPVTSVGSSVEITDVTGVINNCRVN